MNNAKTTKTIRYALSRNLCRKELREWDALSRNLCKQKTTKTMRDALSGNLCKQKIHGKSAQNTLKKYQENNIVQF